MTKSISISKIKTKLHNICIESGITRFKRIAGSRILMYHGIDLVENKQFNGRFIGLQNFEKQIIYYRKNFNIVSLADYYNGSYDSKKFTVTITFDDGYQNNLKYALPVLEKYQVPATFFITGLNSVGENIIWSDFTDIAASFLQTDIELNGLLFQKRINGRLYSPDNTISLYDYVKTYPKGGHELKTSLQLAFLSKVKDFRMDPVYNDYWKLMSDKEIQQLASSKYVEIGSHGLFHNNLGCLSHEDAMIEICSSKTYLENLIQKEIKSIAFPDGSYTRNIINDTEKLGIDKQLAVNYLYEEDILDKRINDRFGVYPFYSANRLGYMLTNKKE